MHIEKLPDRCRRNVSSLFCYESSSVAFFFVSSDSKAGPLTCEKVFTTETGMMSMTVTLVIAIVKPLKLKNFTHIDKKS